MNKNILLTAMLTAFCAVCFADATQHIATARTPSQASGAANSPCIIKTVRSPLGKEIDALKANVAEYNGQVYFMLKQAAIGVTSNHEFITNLMARVEKLEAAEAQRQAFREAAKKRAEERKAKRQEKPSTRETLQGVIKRGQKAAKREGK